MTHRVRLGVEMVLTTGQFHADASWLEELRSELARWADTQMDTRRAVEVELVWQVERVAE